jgi:hypothetical protein
MRKLTYRSNKDLYPSLIILFILSALFNQACTKAKLINGVNKVTPVASASPSPSPSVPEPLPTSAHKVTAIVSGGGIYTGTGVVVHATMGEPLAGGSGIQTGTQVQTNIGLQGGLK